MPALTIDRLPHVTEGIPASPNISFSERLAGELPPRIPGRLSAPPALCAFPRGVLEITELNKSAIVPGKENDCISCGQCEMRCPDYAIFVKKEGA